MTLSAILDQSRICPTANEGDGQDMLSRSIGLLSMGGSMPDERLPHEKREAVATDIAFQAFLKR